MIAATAQACTRFFHNRTIKPLDRYTPEHLPPRRLKRTRASSSTQNSSIDRLKAVRRKVWEQHFGPVYSGKCVTTWCKQLINVWNFQVAHDVARSLGGPNTVNNLVPMCAECNGSMGTTSLKEWNMLGGVSDGAGHAQESWELYATYKPAASVVEPEESGPTRKRQRTS